MKLIPILFSTPMVQAILSGNKSMTRRKCKYQYWSFHELINVNKNGITQKVDREVSCPYGQPGDVLWVRETFEDYKDTECEESTEDNCICGVRYKANNGAEPVIKWKPNIHMPFDICRIFLRVKEIRVERLQDISREDCKREGITLGIDNGAFSGWHDRFCDLWQSINGADSWNANPWVWVIAFESITNENEIAAIRKQWNDKKSLKTN